MWLVCETSAVVLPSSWRALAKVIVRSPCSSPMLTYVIRYVIHCVIHYVVHCVIHYVINVAPKNSLCEVHYLKTLDWANEELAWSRQRLKEPSGRLLQSHAAKNEEEIFCCPCHGRNPPEKPASFAPVRWYWAQLLPYTSPPLAFLEVERRC